MLFGRGGGRLNKPHEGRHYGVPVLVVEHLLSEYVKPAVAGLAKRYQVLYRVVALRLRNALALAVNVVGMKVSRSAALATAVFVSIKRAFAVPAELVVFLSHLAVAAHLQLVRSYPRISLAAFLLLLAGLASPLRASAVNEILSAGRALKDCAERYGALAKAKSLEALLVLRPLVRRGALPAGDLIPGFGLELVGANNACIHVSHYSTRGETHGHIR